MGVPSFEGLKAASAVASRAKRANTRVDTRHEILLRHNLWRLGLRYRKNVRTLVGKPDIVFVKAKVVVFCDGDFWHGRAWPRLRMNLATKTNSDYWVAKIASNRKRDRIVNRTLKVAGWHVVRVWESDTLADPVRIAGAIFSTVHKRLA